MTEQEKMQTPDGLADDILFGVHFCCMGVGPHTPVSHSIEKENLRGRIVFVLQDLMDENKKERERAEGFLQERQRLETLAVELEEQVVAERYLANQAKMESQEIIKALSKDRDFFEAKLKEAEQKYEIEFARAKNFQSKLKEAEERAAQADLASAEFQSHMALLESRIKEAEDALRGFSAVARTIIELNGGDRKTIDWETGGICWKLGNIIDHPAVKRAMDRKD